jgi:macrolide transport system ATP-binding/permease protein
VRASALATLFLTRVLASFSSLLFGVRASDASTLISVALLLIGAALLASYIPARRAAMLDPTEALRQE